MLRLPFSSRLLRFAAPVVGMFCLMFTTPSADAWEHEGHTMINRLAASTLLGADLPAFLRTRRQLINEIEYLGPEPDRWRSPAEPELVAAQAPEHFIDLELADALGPLPHKRFDFEAMVFAAGQRPEKIGLQPWETDEVWERLKAALRQYRFLAAGGQDTKGVEAAIIFYVGWLRVTLCRRRFAAAPRYRAVQRLAGSAILYGYATDGPSDSP